MCFEFETGRLPRNVPTSKDELTRYWNIAVSPAICRNPIVIPVQTVIQGLVGFSVTFGIEAPLDSGLRQNDECVPRRVDRNRLGSCNATSV